MSHLWSSIQVSDLIRDRVLLITDGYRVKNNELGSTGVPFVRGGDIGEQGEVQTSVEDHIVQRDSAQVAVKLSRPCDTVFITKGTVGRVGYLRPEQPTVVFAPQVCLWRSLNPEKLDPRFIYYLLKSPPFQNQLDGVKTHGAMAADYVSISDQFTFRLPIPPIYSQRSVVDVLGTLDDKIDLNRRTNSTLEALARALFKSWFVDFEPVRAKAEGRQPLGMDADTARLFPDEFDDEAPKGWRRVLVSEIASIEKGLSYKGSGLTPSGCPMLSLGCFKRGGHFQRSGVKPYSGEFQPRHTVGAGDIVLANTDITQKRDVLGSPFIVPDDGGRFLFTHHIYAVRLKSDASSGLREYLFYSLLEPAFRERAIGFATGTTVLGLPRDAVLAYEIVLPDAAPLDAFAKVIGPIWARKTQADRESATLQNLRDFLLPKLMSGEVRVRDAVDAVGKVA